MPKKKQTYPEKNHILYLNGTHIICPKKPGKKTVEALAHMILIAKKNCK